MRNKIFLMKTSNRDLETASGLDALQQTSCKDINEPTNIRRERRAAPSLLGLFATRRGARGRARHKTFRRPSDISRSCVEVIYRRHK